jgi:F-type H+-transporting ATPase subunit delta
VSTPVARRYAKALYMIGVEENRLEALTREVKNLAEVVRVSPELSSLLSNPIIAQETRRAVMSDILTRVGVSPTARNFTLLLTDRRRGAMLPAVAEALMALSDERAGKVQAEVSSATALTEAQLQKVRGALEKLTGKTVAITHKVDASLIGGMVTRIGDKVYDGSLKARLDEIRQVAAAN